MIPPRWVYRVFWALDRGLDRLTGGRFDSIRPGPPTLRLTTVGRRTGQQRENAVFYVADGPRWAVVPSNIGSDHDPAWWLNLQAEPNASVRVDGRRHPVRARRATAEEEARLWPRLETISPPFREYRAATTRHIPIVILERRGAS